MLIQTLRYIRGYLKIRVSGYSPERFLNLCKNKQIDIWELENVGNAYEMYIMVSGFRKLRPILKKTKTKVVIEERFGLPFFFYRYRNRTLFFGGCVLCMALIYFLTFFVWNIEFQGNQRITDEVLTEYLETQNVHLGMKKSAVSCNRIVKDLRKDFDEIIWVSVSVKGCNLYVHIKENTDTFDADAQENEPCDLIADKSGIIVSIVTRSGVPKVGVGSRVKEGDLLVSGAVEVLSDAKEVVGYRYVTADADIVIQTEHAYESAINQEYSIKIYNKKEKILPYLKVGEYLFAFTSKKSNEKAEIQTSETQLKIGQKLYLPITVGKKKILTYKEKTAAYTKEEMETLLYEKLQSFYGQLETKNIVIQSSDVQIIHLDEGAKLTATLILLEEVGIQRKIVDF